MDHFLCTLTHNSPRCSLLRNGTQMDSRNPSSAHCYPCRSLRSPSRHQPRLWAQLTRQHREGPLPFSGPFGQRVHGWRQLELPPLYHQLLAASAAQQLRAVHGGPTIVNRFILRGGLSYPPSCESEILPPYIPTPFVQERDPKSYPLPRVESYTLLRVESYPWSGRSDSFFCRRATRGGRWSGCSDPKFSLPFCARRVGRSM